MLFCVHTVTRWISMILVVRKKWLGGGVLHGLANAVDFGSLFYFINLPILLPPRPKDPQFAAPHGVCGRVVIDSLHIRLAACLARGCPGYGGFTLYFIISYCVTWDATHTHTMRCCRSDWPGLCLFSCYQPLCVVSQQCWFGLFCFINFPILHFTLPRRPSRRPPHRPCLE